MNLSKFANDARKLWDFRKSIYLHLTIIVAAGVGLLLLVSCSFYSDVPDPSNTNAPTLEDSDFITVHYNERPPYLVTTASGVRGLTGDPAKMAFEKSNIPFRWKQTPSKRQLYILQHNNGRDCLVGWFKNHEREKFAKYTLPIYQDLPQIALTRADNNKINSGSTVDEIFSDPDLILLVKDGYSYGNFFDRKIATYKPNMVVTTVENSGMLKMVYAGRADYFIIAPEEAEGLIKTSGFLMNDFKSVRLLDIPSGEKRYILCSLQVEDSIIKQLNVAIRQYIENAPKE